LVNEARARLNLPLEDEDYSGNILDTYLSLPQDMPTAGVGVDPDRTHTAADSEVQRPDEPEVVSAPDTMPPLIVTRAEPPAIDFASVTITDAEPAAIANAERTAHDRPPSFTIGATSSAPTVQSEAERRRVGKRGEEVAFVKERERVEAMRANPDLVVWQSKNDELAPFDILSVDHSGDEIYIEVKSTVGSEPSDAFYISNAELLEASFHRSRYYIYRVTDVDTATPRITRWCNPIELIRNAQGRLLLSTAQMELGIEASKPEG
jgi:hypothetical protein